MALDEAVSLCYDWMLEFVCHDMWDKFKTGCDIDQGLLDLSNGVILAQKYRSSENMKSKEVVFLMLTSSLMSLRKSVASGSQGAVRQVEFQNNVRMVADLSAMCDAGDEDLTVKMAEVVAETAVQRILECCREDQYSTAEALFEEVADQLDKETSRKVQAILHAKSRPHRFLQDFSIENYLSTMMEYLEAVYNTFPDHPIMTKHAEFYLIKGAGYNRVRSEYFSREIDGGENDRGELREEEEVVLHKKLQAMRKRKLKEIAVLSSENQNDNHNLEDEDAAEDGKPENSSRSGSSRKKQALRRERERQTEETRQTAERITDRTRKSPSKHRTETKQRSPDRGSHRVASPDRESVTEVSAGEEDTEESDQDDQNASLKTRMPLKIQPFHMRTSLSGTSGKPSSKKPKSKIRRKWTAREEKDFYLAVQQHGVGQWQTIQRCLKTDRSNVQLKDKWRNLIANSYEQLSSKYGPVNN